jgi:CAAX protease family protein
MALGGGWSSFAVNSIAIIALSIIWTWVFNNAKGSILIAMLMHSASNATSTFISTLYPNYAHLPLAGGAIYVFFIVSALLLIVLTKGRLSYKPSKDA